MNATEDQFANHNETCRKIVRKMSRLGTDNIVGNSVSRNWFRMFFVLMPRPAAHRVDMNCGITTPISTERMTVPVYRVGIWSRVEMADRSLCGDERTEAQEGEPGFTLHSVGSEIRTYVTPQQDHLVVGDPTALSRYQLPLDIVVSSAGDEEAGIAPANEVVTIKEIRGEVLFVERGRRGTLPTEHAYPIQVWRLSGNVSIASSTISANHAWAGEESMGGLFNSLHPYVQPTILENVSFA